MEIYINYAQTLRMQVPLPKRTQLASKQSAMELLIEKRAKKEALKRRSWPSIQQNVVLAREVTAWKKAFARDAVALFLSQAFSTDKKVVT